ncbi:MAG: hypothetical protein LBG81_00945, partial [Coriobacteriaceae bacterium]|nr:hypothetical protein [Coriobacteriaceae bacterium]
EMDCNLVTKVAKTFSYTTDDNDVFLTLDATDRAGNKLEEARSEAITIDKTAPIITVAFREGGNGTLYYAQDRIADITVTERNFNPGLIELVIEATYGSRPVTTFADDSKTSHTAVLVFDEGEYDFEVKGKDSGGHEAVVTYSGGNERHFVVDKTKPSFEENFIEFEKDNISLKVEDNSFNEDKTCVIRITERNFDPELAKLRVTRKDPGLAHDTNGLVEATPSVVGGAMWAEEGNTHTISFTVDRDAVYQIDIEPTDLAGNVAEHRSTVVFEIDKTAPVVMQKNGEWVEKDDTELVDLYPADRADAPVPSIEFEDVNIDHLEYDLTVYIPEAKDPAKPLILRSSKAYAEKDKEKSGIVEDGLFTLPDFSQDGVYALEITAIDVAGNKSLLNRDTYARMNGQDVLAYILNNNLDAKTGLYSIEYENGEAISKRPDNFSELEILVLTKKDSRIDIVLRDNNGEEIDTEAQSKVDDGLYGFGIYNFTISPDFFKDTFQDDTDTELQLTVKNLGNRIDLGTIHIDNIAPTYEVPQELESWHWFYGEEERTITVTNISELIDENQCRIYDNGQEIGFTYASADNTISFTLGKGWHDVGIILDDMAGNASIFQERSNIHVGYFWLWIIGASLLSVLIIVGLIVARNIRQRRQVLRLEQA